MVVIDISSGVKRWDREPDHSDPSIRMHEVLPLLPLRRFGFILTHRNKKTFDLQESLDLSAIQRTVLN